MSTAVGAWLERSRAHWDNGDVQGALACCRSALALDPANVNALANSGTLMWVQGDVAGAEATWLHAAGLAPRHAGVALNLATLRNEAGEVEESLAWIAKAEAARPGDPEVIWRKSLLELAMGDYAHGWRHYEAGLGRPDLRGRGPGFRTPAWTGEPCRRLLICHEQGLGDSLQFVRYAELCGARAERVLVLCPRELVAIMKTCPFVDDTLESVGAGDFDQHVSMLSLPFLFGTTLASVPAPIPYLFADRDRAAKWAPRTASDKLKVGLVWSGGFRHGQLRFHVLDRSRNMSLSMMKPWLDLPGIAFFSLQKQAARQPRTAQSTPMSDNGAGDTGDPRLTDHMSEVNDFADTAAIIEHLDLVISVDTSVVHLAAAMGKPVWVLSRLDACWRWLRNAPQNPWYPNARVFGQTTGGDWSIVVAQVGEALGELTHTREVS